MVDILDTNAISSELSKIVSTTNEKLYLISPYLKINDRIKILLQQAGKQSPHLDMRLLYRYENDNESNEKELQSILRDISNIEIYSLKNLHAKCYINENVAIVASMNLHKYSQENNWELGVKISKADDLTAYNEISKYMSLLFDVSDKYENKLFNTKNIVNQVNKFGNRLKSAVSPHNCHCIRCGNKVAYNENQPLCFTCLESWSKYSNKYYQEKFCHVCGKRTNTSYAKPICESCYRSNSNSMYV